MKRKESALRNALSEREQQEMELRRFIEREELNDEDDEEAATTDASVVELHEDDRKASDQEESSGEDFIGNFAVSFVL